MGCCLSREHFALFSLGVELSPMYRPYRQPGVVNGEASAGYSSNAMPVQGSLDLLAGRQQLWMPGCGSQRGRQRSSLALGQTSQLESVPLSLSAVEKHRGVWVPRRREPDIIGMYGMLSC